MPVAQQPSQQQHHHLFSAIGTFLHALQPSSHHNNPNPSSFGIDSPLSSHGASDLADLYQAFESQLARRLSSLLPADESSPSVSLASLKQLMTVLLESQLDLRTLVPTRRKHIKSMEDFLERSIKLLDVCRGIKEQILDMESSQGMLRLVIFCLNSDNGDFKQGLVCRARKALAQLVLHMEVEREDQTDHVHSHRSFRGMLRERLSGNHNRELSPQRWRSWQRNHSASPLSHGNPGSASSSGHANSVPSHVSSVPVVGNVSGLGNLMAVPSTHVAHGAAGSAVHPGGNLSSQTLHTLELNLFPPRLPPKDEEEHFSAAIYALNVLSIFSLGTISAAFPSLGKTHNTVFIQPPHAALWASPFLHLQEKVDEELRKRSKKRAGYGGMWELDQISMLAKRLFELISLDELDDRKEEVKKVLAMFRQHVEELESDMGALHLQINEYYSRVVAARMGVLDMLSDVNDG